MAYARDEVVVLDAEETTEEEDVVTDAGGASPEELKTVEEDTDALEQPEPSNEVISTQADDIVESGTWGTCPWTFSSSGVLTIMPGEAPSQDDSGYYYSETPWSARQDSVTSIVFAAKDGNKVRLPSNCSYLFDYLSALTSMDLSGADTSGVTDMESMFEGCSSLASVGDLSGWDTSAVTDMRCMFRGCSELSSLDLTGWDVSAVTDMGSMFSSCSALASLDLSGWDVSGVTDMRNMFYGCSSLASVGDLSGWDTSGVTDMESMFFGCSSLSSLDLSGWDVSGVTRILAMFSGCSALESLDASGWRVGKLLPVFRDLTGLKSIDLSGWDVSAVTDMRYMFQGCSALSSLDLSGWDVSGVTNMSFMFYGCSSLASLDVSGWRVGDVLPDFRQLSGLESIDLTGWKLGKTVPSFSGLGKLVEVRGLSGWDTSAVTDMGYMFRGCSALASLDLTGWDVSGVTSMGSMFSGCSALASLDLSEWDVSGVTDMRNMFYGCSSLASVGDLSGWDVSGVTSMGSMFSGCSALASLDLSEWDTSQVENLSGMFRNCSSLPSLDLSGWDTTGVTDMGYMFRDCSSLGTLNLAGWDVSGVTSMGSMFSGCSSLSSLDLTGWKIGALAPSFSGLGKLVEVRGLSGWDTSRVESLSGMFQNCSSLPSLDLSGWDTTGVTNVRSMFNGCFSLKSLDLSSWNTSKMTSVESMFASCSALDSFKVGQDYTIKSAEMFPNATSENDLWWSEGTSQWYSKNQIVRNRSGVADTYTSECDPSAKIDLSNATLLNLTAQRWTGRPIEPKPLVALGGKTLTESADYGLSYANNVDIGEATITVTGRGGYSGTLSATFQIEPVAIKSVTVSDIPDQVYSGEAIEPKPTVTQDSATLAEGTDYELHYYSNVNVGTAVAVISGVGNYQGEKSIEFTIKPASIATASISAIGVQSYTGEALTPKPIITLAQKVLSEGIDYTLAYKNNVEIGTATITITGKGNYTGKLSSTFQIEAQAIEPISLEEAVISAIPSQTYTGATIEPEPMVTVDGLVLSKGKDYELSYSNNTNAGTATVLVVGKGTYINETSVTFQIDPASIKSATVATIPTQTYNGSVVEPKPTVRFRGVLLTEDKDYELHYYNNVRAGTAVALISGKGNYQGEKAMAFQIVNPGDGQISLETASIAPLPSRTYTGSAIEPKPTVIANGELLTEDVDYSLSYTDNVNTGTATIIVTSKGYCTGSTTTTFEIEPASISSASIAAIADVAYTGTAVRPKPAVALNNTVLKEGADYELHYFNNISIGTAFVTVTGRNNYTGVQVATFKIAAPPISKATVSTIADQTYTGKAITPKPTVTLGQIKLAENVDYSLEYLNNTNVGAGVVVLTGCGNYEGAKVVTFNIQAASLSPATVSTIAGQSYTGKAVEPKPTIALNGIPLREGTDYTLAYKNNTNAGTASVTATGKGNYTGTKTVTFAIAKATNALSVKAKKKSVKLSAVKKKAQAVAPLKIAGANGTVAYSRVASGSAPQLKVNKKTGKVTVKKGTKKGTYVVKIKVTASGDANHLPASKVVAAKVVVK